MTKVFMTKLFQNGGSKAVRIPAELCPSGPEVFIWREPEGKNLIISETSPSDFDAFFAIQKELLPLLTPDELASEVRFQPPMEVPKFMNARAK
jgi:virulence-associated protein VagC